MSKAALARAGNIAELRELAQRRLPSPLFDFMEGGAEDEGTLRRNTESFDRWDILPRFMTDVAAIDPSTTVLGQKISWPVILSPTGLSRFFHDQGELAIARAARLRRIRSTPSRPCRRSRWSRSRQRRRRQNGSRSTASATAN